MIECILEEFPIDFENTVIWERRQKKSQTITEIEGFIKRTPVLKTFLHIKSSDDNDSGYYRCIIRYQDLELRSDEIELCVYGSKIKKFK